MEKTANDYKYLDLFLAGAFETATALSDNRHRAMGTDPDFRDNPLRTKYKDIMKKYDIGSIKVNGDLMDPDNLEKYGALLSYGSGKVMGIPGLYADMAWSMALWSWDAGIAAKETIPKIACTIYKRGKSLCTSVLGQK